jgi:3-hydroxyisobutyrate dehydrogenase-like beta-hydroxyacid dehydrogenase
MARHLARPDFDLAVWNRTAARAEAFAAAHDAGP